MDLLPTIPSLQLRVQPRHLTGFPFNINAPSRYAFFNFNLTCQYKFTNFVVFNIVINQYRFMENLNLSLNSFTFNTTPSIRFGNGQIKDSTDELLSLLGSRILFITDKDLTKLGLYDPMLDIFKTRSADIRIFDAVESDPSLNTLLSAVHLGQEFNATGIIGFGGGSPMDVAKLVALLVGSGENIDDAWGVAMAKGPRLPLVLVPTTAGTGSEVTPVSIITLDDGEKRGVSSSKILPDISVLDPELTMGLPRHTTAATGVDAMVHAIEAFASKSPNNNPISKMLAKEALHLIGGSIEDAVENGGLEARGNMLLGSMFAGMAFANSPVAAVHALAYPIGGTFHISHGLSNALMLPEVLKFNSIVPEASNAYSLLAPIVFPTINCDRGSQAITTEFINLLEDLSKRIGLPPRLRDVDIPQDACLQMSKDAMKQTRLLVNNPREVSQKDAFDIYNAVW